MERKVDIVLKAKDEASKVFDKITTNSLPNLAKSVAAAAAGFVTFQAAAGFLRKAFDEALKSEQAAKQLATAIRAQGQSVDAMLPRLQKYAEALAKVSTATDEEIQAVQQTLISVGGLAGETLDRATKAALDFAAGTGRSLPEAAEAIAKAAQGSTKAFGQLGVSFDGAATDGEKLARVLGWVNANFKGMAEAQTETTAGKIGQLSKAWDELAESLGKFVTEASPALAILKTLTSTVNALRERVEGKNSPLMFSGAAIVAVGATGRTPNLGPKAPTAEEIAAEKRQKFIEEWRAKLFKQDSEDRAAAEAAARKAAEEAEKAYVRAMEVAFGVDATTDLMRIQVDLRERVADLVDPDKLLKDDLKSGTSKSIAVTVAEEIDAALAKSDKRETQMSALEMLEKPISSAEEGMQRLAEVARLVRDGIVEWTPALQDSYRMLQLNVTQMNSMGTAVKDALGEEAQQYAVRFGDTLVDAAFGAEVAWGDFFKQLIADMVKAIIKALILQMISAAMGGEQGGESNGSWFTSALPGGETIQAMERGGRAPVYAAGGLMIPRGFDTIPAMLKPGELVIPSHAAKQVASGDAAIVAANGGGLGATHVHNWYVMDGPSVRDFIRRNAREFEAGLEYLAARRA